MSATNILVVATEPDLIAEGLLAEVLAHTGMRLACKRVLSTGEVADVLSALGEARPCAVVLVGKAANADQYSQCWLRDYPHIVVVRATLADNLVHFDASGVGLDTLLATVRELASRQGALPGERVACVLVHSAPLHPRPLLAAALDWVQAAYSAAVAQQHGEADEIPGLALSAGSLQRQLAAVWTEQPEAGYRVAERAAALAAALAGADPASEPLAALYHRLGLDLLEWKILLLALATECDSRYQRCAGFLLDDMSRRSGSLALFAGMLGDPIEVRRQFAERGRLLRWRLLDSGAGFPAPDEPFQLDPRMVDWLCGREDSLADDPRLCRALRPLPWQGAALLRTPAERDTAAGLDVALGQGGRGKWLVLGGPDLAGWRALLELAGQLNGWEPLRLQLPRLLPDPAEIAETTLRAARSACLEGRPLVLDAQAEDDEPVRPDTLQAVFAALAGLPCGAAIVGDDMDAIFCALGGHPAQLMEREHPGHAARAAMVAAAAPAPLALDAEEAAALGHAFPLPVDVLARAGRFAQARSGQSDSRERLQQHFVTACRSTASQRLSRLAQRIVPRVRLADVVLPEERRSQLREIVSNVRLGPKVYEEWGFGERLPHGRGVAVLFHGPSGTGKSMAAQAIAHELGVDVFALDLSRVVSKYIGETEKNIDAVFSDAERCGAAVLIDEADALLGKRSEVKDAHDRYANIEVAYLLQRMETFTGLAILTSNIRHNLDQAFLRRLRFVIEFPRPDVRARADIWRLCLPASAHALGERELALLARQAELTGGHIRQISLRAAFAAAADDTRIGIAHLQHATNAELTKLGLPGIDLSRVEAE
jgi:AAA+ superfamily predicted ATPase